MHDKSKSAYGKLCTLIYDLDKPFAGSQEIGSYTKHIPSKSSKILEAMCGSGRFLIPMLKEGYSISGFDSSDDMLKACADKCSELDLHTRLFIADVTNFRCEEKYDHVLITAGSASLLTNSGELAGAFRNIYDCLVPGGSFIFTYVGTDDRPEGGKEWREVMSYPHGRGEITCREKVFCEAGSNIADHEYMYELSESGKVIETEYQKLALRRYSFAELKTALQECGFRGVHEAEGCDDENECGMVICRK